MGYKVYQVGTQRGYYGTALVSAESAEEANAFILDYVNKDKKNYMSQKGYEEVDEICVIDGVYGIREGVLLYDIYYSG